MCLSTDERKPCARYLDHERRECQSLLVIVDCKVSQSQLMEATAQIVEGFLARATYAEVSIKEGEALPKRKGQLSMFTLERCPPKRSTLKKSRMSESGYTPPTCRGCRESCNRQGGPHKTEKPLHSCTSDRRLTSRIYKKKKSQKTHITHSKPESRT